MSANSESRHGAFPSFFDTVKGALSRKGGHKSTKSNKSTEYTLTSPTNPFFQAAAPQPLAAFPHTLPPPYSEVDTSDQTIHIEPPTTPRGASPSPSSGPPSSASRLSAASISIPDDPYAFLSTFDTIFLIDNSGSMAAQSWREARDLLRAITPICTSHDSDGIDVYFLNPCSPVRGAEGGSCDIADEDWTKIKDPAERRLIQNRIAQRNYRTELKRRAEELEQRAAKVDGCVSAGDAEHGANHSGKPGETKRADWNWDQFLPGGVHSQRYAASSKTMENLSWRMWCSSSPGSSSSRGTAEFLASRGGEHGGILWEKDRSKVEDEDPSRWGLHRQPQPTWDQMGAFDVSGGMEGHPNLSRRNGDTPSSLGLPPPIKVDINGVIDKGFFLADNEWTCYRRNYFSCVPSYSVSSPGHPNTTTQFPSSSPLSLGTTLHRVFRSSPARPGRRRSLPPFLTPLLILLAASPVSAQHPALLHIAAGASFATSATIPPLRGSSTVPAPWWIAMYAAWGAAFVVFLMLELRRVPDWAQRRLLVGLFVFSGLNLTGSLVQGEDSVLEGVASWGPLAMTVSLWLVPALIEFWGVRGAVEMAGV